TIGLCSDPQCANLNRADLTNMAQETGGFSYTGDQQEVRQLFQQIMDALNSQMVAQTQVCPHQGNNQAALSVKLRNSEPALSTTFDFPAGWDCSLPVGPVAVQIISVRYDAAEDVFNLSLSIRDAPAMSQLIVQVWDKNGSQLAEENKFDGPPASLSFARHTAGMQSGREYCFKLLALNRQQEYLQTEDGKSVLAEQCVIYEPEQKAAVEFNISAVTPDFEQEKLLIDLNFISFNAQPDKYQVFINDHAGSRVAEFGPTVYQQEKQFVLDLPPAMQQLDQPRQYKTTVEIITKDDRVTQQEYEFQAIPPGRLARFASNLAQPLVIFGMLGLVVVSMGAVGGWLFARNRRSVHPQLHGFSRKNTAELHRPPVDPTMLSTDRAGAPLRLRLSLSLSNQQRHRQELSQFPCVLGRLPRTTPYQLTMLDDEAGYLLNVPDDNISRRHVQLTLRNNKFYITDLKSRNGTFVADQRLEPERPTPLSMVGPTTVKLGLHVQLEIEPLP
ncbi:MAG TPA: FHA domain-containing protein, partial [Anaerolineae bacterium]|nr:FHA domain-containing protein [Anaerolineae bacterium]